jgi:glycosyltransferase involved in cell wall biosynthesis
LQYKLSIRFRQLFAHTMLISVIVPFLNEEKHIEGCLNALLHQDRPEGQYELIFVDNGSTDRSAEILRRSSRVRLLAEPERDPYLARNRGIQSARGEILAFTDADCRPDRAWLTVLAEAFLDPGVDVVLGSLLYPPQSSRTLRYLEDYLNLKMDFQFRRLPSECHFGNAGNMAVRTSAFRSFGLFPRLPILGDTELVRHCAGRAVYRGRARVIHEDVRTLGQWLAKQFAYGAMTRRFSNTIPYRPLSLREKTAVARFCMKEAGYAPRQRVQFAVLLAIGLVAYQAGWLRRSRTPPVPADANG